MSSQDLEILAKYSACDVSDALVKLGFTTGGFLADLYPVAHFAPQSPSTYNQKTIAPASTVQFVPKLLPSAAFPDLRPSNISSGTPYADLAVADSIVVISQPAVQHCAVMGGIMASRMARRGVKGVVVSGRVRDLGVLSGLGERGMPVWARATSIVGAGAEAKAWAVGVSVEVGGVTVHPGDIIFIDPSENGVVAIPKAKLAEVMELLPGLVEEDEKVLDAVKKGTEVEEAFRQYRN
ncbi:RraA-like protein [Patellaria atrata CBS 101060]|uniref:RraA-like protein n=1 Tax=Patellaria atrata CBS 101060 TaxID=1346257 RepID=A0A9P4SFE9_9PEZI|nr:RraA-like protein [Patellaria atrata CBS 101060]